ncbi:MAG: restriction endonuclease subunit S, partial [Gammaproteobacteria bacterium]|nr:restriction endonuclease subunit S [Gammaproteobacteria bacterium]
ITRIFAGSSAPQGKDFFSESGAPFVRVSDLGNCNAAGVLETTRDHLSRQAVADCPLVKAPKGAVLFPKSGAAIATNRRAVLGMDAYIVGHLFALVANSEAVTMEWLYSAMRQIDMMEHSDNVGYPSLKKSAVEKITIPLPPLAEQKRIVAVLNRQLAAVEGAREAALGRVEAAQSLPAAWLREVFSFGGERLPHGWQWIKLGNACEINPRRPKGFDRADEEPTTFIPMDAVSATYGMVDRPQTRPYGEIKKGYTFFSDGDVMFAKITPCMQNGKHFIAGNSLDGVGFASTEFHVLRPGDSLLAEWAHFYLRQPAILKEATYHFTGTVGQQRVPDSFLKELSIPLPPLAQQKRLVASLNAKMAATERVRAAAGAELEAITALPAALLREAFSGAL